MAIRVKLDPLESKTAFPYLRSTVMYNNSNWAALYSNLRKAQRRWGMIEKVMGKTMESFKDRDMMYNMVVQAGLLYSSEIWMVTDEMMTVHEVFHQRTPRSITGMTARRGKGGEWEWASVDTALEVTRICPVRGYVKRWKATIVE